MSSDRFRGGEPRWNRGEFEQEQGRFENRERLGRSSEERREFEYREPFEQDRWRDGEGQWGQGPSSYESSRGQRRGFSQPQADGEPYERGSGRGWQGSQPYERYGMRQGYAERGRMSEGDRRESRSYGSGRAEYSEGSPSSPGRVSSSGSRRFSGYGEEQWRPSDRYDGFDRSSGSGEMRLSRRLGAGSSKGRFTGKGPKGYRRSDDRIKEDVSEALARDGDLDASEIEVIVASGEVTLEGTVSDRESKRLAEDLVEDLPGVAQIHNRLRIENGRDRGEREGETSRASAKGASSSSSPSASPKSSSRSTI